MKESYKEELAIHFGLDPYAGDGDISGVASARGNAGQLPDTFNESPLMSVAPENCPVSQKGT